jgi:hypothetical protein
MKKTVDDAIRKTIKDNGPFVPSWNVAIRACYFCGDPMYAEVVNPEDAVCNHCEELSGAEKLMLLHKKKEATCTTSATARKK